MSTATGKKTLSLGALLLEQGVITEQQLENAIQEQRRTRVRLGRVLITSGACTEEDIARVLARQLHLSVTRAEHGEVDVESIRALGDSFFRERYCVPLVGKGGDVRLVLADPFDVETTEVIQKRLDRPVVLEVGTPRMILELLDAVSDEEGDIERMLAEAHSRAVSAGEQYSEADFLSADEILKKFVAQGVRRGSADIHVEPEEDLLRIRYRIDGVLLPGPMIPREMTGPVVARIKIISDLDIAERRLPQDGRSRIEIDGITYDLRVSVLPTVKGESVVMRVLDSTKTCIPLNDLGLSDANAEFLRSMVARPHGLFLVTGPTGSGKSTTLYAMLAQINALERKVITVEDPVEYKLPLIRQVQVHSEIGLSFASGLRSILRQDPDVILVGEIRDQETAEIATRAAMTGHLVLSTLHANTAIGAITRLVDIGIDPFLITSTLCGVLGQRLVRRLCRRCATTRAPSASDLERIGSSEGIEELWDPKGCDLCGPAGFKGRIGVHEVLRITNPLRRMVLEQATEEELETRATEEGFQSIYRDALEKVRAGMTTLDEIDRVVREQA